MEGLVLGKLCFQGERSGPMGPFDSGPSAGEETRMDLPFGVEWISI